MATQTYGFHTNAQRNFYVKTLLKRARPFTPMFADAVKASIPGNHGLTAEWRVYGGSAVATTGAGISLATTALTEGVAPTEAAFTVAKVTKAVAQYGNWLKASDLLEHQGIDPIWTNMYEMLGENAGQTLHTLLINDLAAGTNVQYASTAVSRVTVTAAMVLSGAEIREAVRNLRRSKVPTFPDGYYHALIHPDASFDLQNDTDWKAMNTNVGGSADGENSMVKGMIGRLHGVKFVESTDAPKFTGAGSGGVDVFGALFYGPGWYGVVDLDRQPMPSINPETNMGMQVTGVPVNTPTKDDPLGQFGVAGWKTTYGGKILQEWRGVRLEHGATA